MVGVVGDMNRVSLGVFRKAIRDRLGANPRIRNILAVSARSEQGELLWNGEVIMFELEGHPSAQHCFAWEIADDITIVCEDEKIRSAYDAVMSIITRKRDA
jgi:hypothetical protein